MNRAIRSLSILLALGLTMVLSGCIYDPGYYHRGGGVVYSDDARGQNGNAVVDADDDAGYDYDYGYAAPGYYYGPYGYGWPFFGLGFYGNYYCCGHGYRGPWRHGYAPHGSWSGGHGAAHGSSHPSSSGHSSSSHH